MLVMRGPAPLIWALGVKFILEASFAAQINMSAANINRAEKLAERAYYYPK